MTAKQTVSRKIQIIRRPFSRFSSVAALRPEILTCDRISFSFSDLWRFSRLMVTENDPWLLPLGWFGTWKEEFVNGVKSDLFLRISVPIKLVWSSQFLRFLSFDRMLLDQGDHVYLFLLVKIGVFFIFVLFSFKTKLKGQVKQSSRRTNCFKKRSIWSLFVFAVISNFFTNTCWLPKNGQRQVEKFSTISNVHIAKSVFAKCVNVEVDDFIKSCLFVFVP